MIKRISIDDYSEHNITTARIIKDLGLEGITTFYIAPLNEESLKQIKFLYDKGFNIGSHTINHVRLSYLPESKQKKEIVESKFIIQNLINDEVTSFCPPRGWYTDLTLKIVKNAGYKEMRTMKQGVIKEPKGYIKGITNHIYPLKLYYYSKEYMHITAHSWEIERFNMWKYLEDKLKELK